MASRKRLQSSRFNLHRSSSLHSQLEQALSALPFELSLKDLIKSIEYHLSSHLKKNSYINHGLNHDSLQQDVSHEILCHFMTEKGLKCLAKAQHFSYIKMVIKSRVIDRLKAYTRHSNYELPTCYFTPQNDDQEYDIMNYLSHNDDIVEEQDVAGQYQRRNEVNKAIRLLFNKMFSLPKRRRAAFIIEHWDGLIIVGQGLGVSEQDLIGYVVSDDLNNEDVLYIMKNVDGIKQRIEALVNLRYQDQEQRRRAYAGLKQNQSRANRTIKALMLIDKKG